MASTVIRKHSEFKIGERTQSDMVGNGIDRFKWQRPFTRRKIAAARLWFPLLVSAVLLQAERSGDAVGADLTVHVEVLLIFMSSSLGATTERNASLPQEQTKTKSTLRLTCFLFYFSYWVLKYMK